MKNFLKRNGGIILGAVYGLVLRLIFNGDFPGELLSLFGITFLGVVPIVIGLIPLFLATPEQLDRWKFRITSPMITVFLFFGFCFMARIEDLVCLVVISVPYMACALVVGLIAGGIISHFKDKRPLYSIVLLPFIISPIEQQFESPKERYSIITKVIIDADAETIWRNIVRVQQIQEHEFEKGFFNYAGIPRPLYAELDKDTLGATRVGHFEGGLQFVEKVISWERNKHIGFDITVVPSSIRQTVFDQHILKGKHFKFLQAGYTLTPLANGQTELALRSSYELSTKINGYASYCGDWFLTDFQERLLQVIKKRCDRR